MYCRVKIHVWLTFISVENVLAHCLEQFNLKFNLKKKKKEFPERYKQLLTYFTVVLFLNFLLYHFFLVYLSGFIESLKSLLSVVALLLINIFLNYKSNTSYINNSHRKHLSRTLRICIFQVPSYVIAGGHRKV